MKTPVTIQFKPTLKFENIDFINGGEYSDSETTDIDDYKIIINLTFMLEDGVLIESPSMYLEMFSLTLKHEECVKSYDMSYDSSSGTWEPPSGDWETEMVEINQTNFDVHLNEDHLMMTNVDEMADMFKDMEIYIDFAKGEVEI